MGKVTVHHSGEVKAGSHITTSVKSREKHAHTLPAECQRPATACLMPEAGSRKPDAGCVLGFFTLTLSAPPPGPIDQ